MIGKNTSHAVPDDDRLLLHAYLDEELDARAVLELERRIASDAHLKAECDRIAALRAVLAGNVTKDIASDALRKRIARITSPVVSNRKFQERRFDWRAVAASTAVAACFASAATFLMVVPDPASRNLEAIVAGHQRALLAAQPVDVASSDRHTVKPWFDSKLALSPRVLDLAADGFPLVGGRVEIVEGKPVPTLVYRRREHLLSVVAIPKAGARDDGAAPTRKTTDGYTVLTWPGDDFVYSAVSDVAVNELEGFVSRFREASKSM